MFSISTVLRERASLQPNDIAFTYVDYEHDWDGVAENLTWSQVYRRTLNLAQQLRLSGSTGDRAVILAPQGLEYIISFFGAIQGGLIPVPLAVPLGGVSDERVSSVMRDATPAVILTTSAVVENVREYAQPGEGESAQRSSRSICWTWTAAREGAATARKLFGYRVSAVHLRVDPGAGRSHDHPAKSSVEFRAAGVRLLFRVRRGGIAGVHDRCRGCPSITTWAWCGSRFPVLGGLRAVLTSPVGVPAATGPVDEVDGEQ